MKVTKKRGSGKKGGMGTVYVGGKVKKSKSGGILERNLDRGYRGLRMKNECYYGASGGELGKRKSKKEEKRIKDSKRKNLPRMERNQDFKKRKNVRRRVEREGIEEEEQKKWRKVPEKERTKRKPEWEELSNRWDMEMSKLEKGQRSELRKGGKRKGSKYVDLGKTRVYSYGIERNNRGLGKKE